MTTTHPDTIGLLRKDSSQLLALLRGHDERLRMHAHHTAPQLKLEDMWTDIEQVIGTIAFHYTDKSCPGLHTDELVGQGMEKLAKLIDKGILDRFKDRVQFFAFFKTAINNHIRGQVQKYRFTIKRTGIKPPPKHERHLHMESTKPIEVSLDDEEAHLQVGDTISHDVLALKTMLDDLKVIMTPIEFLVLNQMHEANSAACLLAEIDAMRGKTLEKPVDPDITPSYQAAGLGINESLYREVSVRVQQKVLGYMHRDETEEDVKFNLAVANLERVFMVQVPKHFERVVIKRLFTLLARRYIDKVQSSNEIKLDLTAIGAKVPEPRGPTMPCFGVLYQKGNKVCEMCSIKTSCATEAANFGLGEIILHPEVLGARQMRIPTLGSLAPTPSSQPLQDTIPDNEGSSERDDSILHHLAENFRSINIRRGTRVETGFKHKDKTPGGVEKIIFCVSRKAGLSIRFCNPPREMKDKLESIKNGSYLPKGAAADNAITLINEHARLTFV